MPERALARACLWPAQAYNSLAKHKGDAASTSCSTRAQLPSATAAHLHARSVQGASRRRGARRCLNQHPQHTPSTLCTTRSSKHPSAATRQQQGIQAAPGACQGRARPSQHGVRDGLAVHAPQPLQRRLLEVRQQAAVVRHLRWGASACTRVEWRRSQAAPGTRSRPAWLPAAAGRRRQGLAAPLHAPRPRAHARARPGPRCPSRAHLFQQVHGAHEQARQVPVVQRAVLHDLGAWARSLVLGNKG